MKNNLLLTTALVSAAFAFTANAWADTEDKSKPETVTGKETISGETYEGYTNGAITNQGTLTVKDSHFNGNENPKDGGAISSSGTLNIEKSTFRGNKATGKNLRDGYGAAIVASGKTTITNSDFIDNNGYGEGGAIHNKGNMTITGGLFKNNLAGGGKNSSGLDKNSAGGAIYVHTSGTLNVDGTSFKENRATTDGGAIYSLGSSTIQNATFNQNTATQKAGALYFGGNGTNKIEHSVFTDNIASTSNGGAVYTQADLDISDSRFSGNTAEKGRGGAIEVYDKSTTITRSIFENNSAAQGGAIDLILNNKADVTVTATDSIFRGNTAGQGGAISNFETLSLKKTTFEKNKTIETEGENDAGSGGALFLGSNSTTTLDDVTFSGNSSTNNGGAIGTRETIDNPNLKLTVNGAIFTDNHADGEGGALYLGKNAKATFESGEIVFRGNTDKNGLNDIALSDTGSELTVKQGVSLSLDGGISGQGKLKLEKGSTLTVKDTTNIEAQTSVESGTGLAANLNVVVTGKTTKNGKLALYGTEEEGAIFQGQDGETPLKDLRFDTTKNNLFNFDTEDEGKTYEVSAKSTREIAKALGVNNTEASTLLAVSSTESTGNAKLDSVLSNLQVASQYEDGDFSKEADALTADAAPVVQTRETMLSNLIFDAANDALDDNASALVVGQASGDSLVEKAKIWIKGLFNSADKDGTSKSHGFDIDTYGVAMGADKEIGAGKVGLGYAYNQSDINGYTRDTDVDTHSVFVYGQYQPADWYVKGVASYSWSDYEEKKSVLGHDAKAKYDVDTLALQGLYGYDFHLDSGYDITPEGGLRYLHASQDSYTNGLGVRVKDRDIDVWTAVAGVKVAKDFAVSDSVTIRPELRAALTYDLKADDNDSVVTMGNTSYRLNGEKLDRFGVELGAKLATDITSNWEVAAGYEGRFREDYSDHTGMLSAKYRF